MPNGRIPVYAFVSTEEEAKNVDRNLGKLFGACLFDVEIIIVGFGTVEERSANIRKILRSRLEELPAPVDFIVSTAVGVNSAANADTIAERVKQLSLLSTAEVIELDALRAGEQIIALPNSTSTVNAILPGQEFRVAFVSHRVFPQFLDGSRTLSSSAAIQPPLITTDATTGSGESSQVRWRDYGAGIVVFIILVILLLVLLWCSGVEPEWLFGIFIILIAVVLVVASSYCRT